MNLKFLLPKCLIFSLLSFFVLISQNISNASEYTAQAKATPPYKVAMFYPRDAPFWTNFINLMNEAALDLGIELQTFSAKGNRILMKQQFMSVLEGENKVDAVIFNNYKNSAAQFIKLANEAKVYSFLVNSAMTAKISNEMGLPREKYPYWVGQMYPDEKGANQRITNILIDDARDKYPEQEVNIIGINGPISSGAAIMRLDAFKEAVEQHKNVKLHQVVNVESWDETEASIKFQALMKRYKQTHIVWAGSARLVDGVLMGEKSLGLTAGNDYFTGGVGFKKSMLDAIQKGQVSAAAGGHYIEGAWSLVLIFDYLSGEDFVDHGVELLTPMGLVTKENVQLYIDNLTQEKWTKNNLRKINFRQYSKVINPELDEYQFNFDSIIFQLY
ncbi:hypothetical protein OA92_19570 [Marinomonas sp. SBI22]|uniref:ABC transporter substrate-binding protein n=1 Tax=unclassified Marinomonas TaxID=196814 RepID=UPI0007AEFE8E|nr:MULTISPECIES: ABC transporter substrate-binding protein [unclassified Marinomonas]KZM39518.1 hypothetical protein OA92_19570 [Marinomonas sp. SBI22]KZM41912.1 hypothetical protein OA91_15760 [Marinomonas sp. SBI8L]